MPLSATLRKAAVLTHIISSVGWIGAVAAFLCLAVTGVKSADSLTTRAAYLAMESITSSIIIPFAFASLISGLLLSLGTKWGLFRHYWILAKLLINALSIFLLLLHDSVIHQVVLVAAKGPLSSNDLPGPRAQLIEVSIAALAALLVATLLSVFKPRGLTPYGWRRQQA
jgi:hypothetical protein